MERNKHFWENFLSIKSRGKRKGSLVTAFHFVPALHIVSDCPEKHLLIWRIHYKVLSYKRLGRAASKLKLPCYAERAMRIKRRNQIFPRAFWFHWNMQQGFEDLHGIHINHLTLYADPKKPCIFLPPLFKMPLVKAHKTTLWATDVICSRCC